MVTKLKELISVDFRRGAIFERLMHIEIDMRSL